MATFEIYTRSYYGSGYCISQAGKVPASGSINCIHFLDHYFEGDNDLESVELHVLGEGEDFFVRYCRDWKEWELEACGDLEEAAAY